MMTTLSRFAAPLRFAAITAVVAALVYPPRSVASALSPAVAPTPTLTAAEPFRLTVSSSGTPQEIKVRGTNFLGVGGNRDQYMHWQIRRDDGSWQRCASIILNSAATCRVSGWGPDFEFIQIGGSYTAREGFVELRLFTGLAVETETDPARAPTPTEWSNVLRVPVVVPGPAPAISSLSKTTFPLTGTPAEYQFFINATGLDASAVVVFRGDVVVAPERMSDGRIQVTVPQIYRVATSIELPLTVRTNRGGDSPRAYIKFAAPPQLQVMQPRPELGPDTKAVQPGAQGRTTTAVQLPGAAAGVRRSDVCMSGFVWREATPQDRACVTPEARSRTAQQNSQAAARRDPNAASSNPAACRAGFVWREAVPGDVVCVTPAERTQAAEDTRLAASRVVP